MSDSQILDLLCTKWRLLTKDEKSKERIEEVCARRWAKVIAGNDSTQKRKAKALQNGRVLV